MTQTGYLPPETSGTILGPVAASNGDPERRPPVWAAPALLPPSDPGIPPLRRFVHLPTRLEPLDRLSEVLGGPRIWIKRDDCTGLAGGGNKARKLEWLVADALERGADVLLTTGGVQSNHARQTAAAAAKAGLECELWLVDGVPNQATEYRISGNVLLDRLLRARTQILPAGTDPDSTIAQWAAELVAQGRCPYVIPAGGSATVGAQGYIGCANEIVDQAHQFGLRLGTIVHATGSGGTQAGLTVGLIERGSRARVIGVSVGGCEPDIRAKVNHLSTGLTEHLSSTKEKPEIEIDDSHIGDGYGAPTPACLEAIKMLAELEGILLDPVYTGKAMAALIEYVRQDRFPTGDDVLFVHTGGWPALYGYSEDLSTLLSPIHGAPNRGRS
ncbi:MAG: pyridoxal-phosphate dependent enzyme [Pseudonocardiaceae bacterium]|nr:pyridoxal-phosphate dependent enzyme [Pseudonocardiaceae bacterium]